MSDEASKHSTGFATIRVKDFVKVGLFQSKVEADDTKTTTNGNSDKQLPIDIETISLSSNDDFEPTPRKVVKRTPNPKQKRQTPSRTAKPTTTPARAKKPTTTPSRSHKTPLNFKNHKISEYFSAKKTDASTSNGKLSNPSTNICSLNDVKSKPTEPTEVQQVKSNLRSVKIVLRRLSIEKAVDTTKKRKVQEDQSRLPEFINYEPICDGYFATYDQSTVNDPNGVLPNKQNDPNNALQTNDIIPLENPVKTELNNFDIESVSLQSNDIDEETSKSSMRNGEIDSGKSVSVKEDTESKSGSTSSGKSTGKTKKETKSKNPSKKKQNKKPSKAAVTRRKKVECPYYKIVDDTKLAVDAFRYGDIEGVEHYFLSHFHADHYIGLKKSFNHKLYVSKITGRLVVEFIKVDEKYITCLDINTPTIVDEVEVTCLDANHCPGAVMFLFKFKTGKCILHTGDFRACADMEEYPEFWNNDIHTIYLDTTYLSSRYEFPTQSDSITNVLQHCREFVKSSTSSSGKHLIICGAYKVGKEKVWLRIAQEFDYKVWIDDERHKAMHCIQNDEINQVLTRHAKDASIHVLPLGNISYPFIVEYVKQFGESFCKVLAIRPSGWERSKNKPNFANKISILGVQYSEHSSYNELERFVRFLRPKQVISTVPFSSQNLNRTPKVPDSWMNPKIEPKTKGYQRNIKDYMLKKGEKASATKETVDDTSRGSPIRPDENQSNEMQGIVDSISISDSSDYMP